MYSVEAPPQSLPHASLPRPPPFSSSRLVSGLVSGCCPPEVWIPDKGVSEFAGRNFNPSSRSGSEDVLWKVLTAARRGSLAPELLLLSSLHASPPPDSVAVCSTAEHYRSTIADTVLGVEPITPFNGIIFKMEQKKAASLPFWIHPPKLRPTSRLRGASRLKDGSCRQGNAASRIF